MISRRFRIGRAAMAAQSSPPILADVFGFAGTPDLVVGRTVPDGAIRQTRLRRSAEDETSMPVPVG